MAGKPYVRSRRLDSPRKALSASRNTGDTVLRGITGQQRAGFDENTLGYDPEMACLFGVIDPDDGFNPWGHGDPEGDLYYGRRSRPTSLNELFMKHQSL